MKLRSLRSKLTISLVFASLVLLAYTILFEYTNSRDQILAVEQRSLEAIADMKVAAINNYFENFKHDAAVMQNQDVIKEYVPILSKFVDKKNTSAYINAKKILDKEFKTWSVGRSEFNDLVLLNTNGKVIYTSNPRHVEQEFNKNLTDACGVGFPRNERDIYISDLQHDPDEKDYSFSIIAPIFSLDNKFIGEFVVEVLANDVFSIVNNKLGLGETGETVIGKLISDVSTRGVLASCYDEHGNVVQTISHLRSDPRVPFARLIKIGSVNGKGLQEAAQGKSGSGIFNDYDGQKVLAVWRHMPERHWGIVTKINYVELMRPALRVVEASTIFGPIMFFVLILLAVRLASSISAPVVKLTEVAKQIGAGHLDVEFDENLTSAENEVGILAATLKKSAANLLDIYSTLEKKVEDRTSKIKEAEAKEDAVLKSIGDGIINTDQDGLIVFVGSAACKMLNLDSKEMIGKKITDVIHIQDETGKPISSEEGPVMQALKFGKTIVHNVYPKVYFFVRNDNSKFPVSVTTTPVKLNGEIIGAIEVFRDITVEYDIDRAKTEFVSLASHQLRSPLTAINWYTEMLAAGDAGKLTDKQKKFLSEVRRSSHRMVELINGLLNVARLESGTFIIEPEPVDIAAIAQSVYVEMQSEIKKKKLKYTTDFEPLPKISTDPRLIRMILQNLLSNSLKYTPANGKITVSIKKKGPDFLVAVSDTGYGIPTVDQSKIFTKLFRADNVQQQGTEGTGLGLYLVKSIIHFMEGDIWFESVEDKGTTFYVSLPLSGVKPKKGSKLLE